MIRKTNNVILHSKKSLLLLLIQIFISFSTCCFSQNIQNELNQSFTEHQLLEDLNLFKTTIEALHIDLYAYSSEEKINYLFDSIASTINQSMTALDFFRKITPLNPLIGNVHTSFIPPATIWNAIKHQLPLFPFEVYWNRDSLYIIKNLSKEEAIIEGSIIESINGKSTQDIFKTMINNLKRDGFNRSYPIKRAFTSFGLVYSRQFGITEEFRIKIKEPSGKQKIYEVKGLSEKELEKQFKKRYNNKYLSIKKDNEKALDFSVLKNAAYLQIKTFSLSSIKSKNQNFNRFCKQSFRIIRKYKIKNLILDLRGNTGGQPEPTIKLLSYFFNEPFTIYRSIEAKVDCIPDSSYFIKDGSIKLFSKTGWRKKDSHFELKENTPFKLVKPIKKRFNGNVYVLIDGFTNSAAGTFAGQMKKLKQSCFIGEEAGGNPNKTVARQIVTLVLPNSRVQIKIPLVLSVKNVPFQNTGHGVIPNHIVNTSAEALIQDKDPVIEKAIKLILKN